ncbi:MAG TPA: nucleotide sugar dehydrogenase, partial [bacterium]|nr:nucleotide sugar dehydrogenase [bacterium]
LERVLFSANPRAQLEVASNPEFLREGAAVLDFMKPERVIVGTRSARAEKLLRQIYQPLIREGANFLNTTPESAELTKYASNAFLATKISFMNEVAFLAEKLGADVTEIAKGMGLDSRIGSSFLQPGPGYGGSCFPKDTVALLRAAQEHSASMRILETVVEVNHAQKARMVRKIIDALGGETEGKKLAVLGLSFKAGTDDIREAPSLSILPILLEKGISVRAHDPAGMENARSLMPELQFCESAYQACSGADALCLMTDWDEYKKLNLKKLKSLLATPTIVDLRNAFDPEAMRKEGLYYSSLGRPVVELSEKKKVVALRRANGRKS